MNVADYANDAACILGEVEKVRAIARLLRHINKDTPPSVIEEAAVSASFILDVVHNDLDVLREQLEASA